MKKKIFIIFVLIISHTAVLLVGSFLGGHTKKTALIQWYNRENAIVALAHYEIFRNIARNLRSDHTQTALCSAELEASSNLDDVTACLADKSCKSKIEKDVDRIAPEIKAKTALEFKYIKDTGQGYRCDQ